MYFGCAKRSSEGFQLVLAVRVDLEELLDASRPLPIVVFLDPLNDPPFARRRRCYSLRLLDGSLWSLK